LSIPDEVTTARALSRAHDEESLTMLVAPRRRFSGVPPPWILSICQPNPAGAASGQPVCNAYYRHEEDDSYLQVKIIETVSTIHS
jgi:hypothetical protein